MYIYAPNDFVRDMKEFMNGLRIAHTTQQRVAVYCITLHYTVLAGSSLEFRLSYSAGQYSTVLYGTILTNLPPCTTHLTCQPASYASS